MKIELFFQPENRLCAHIEGEKCVMGVKPVWASPLSRPNQYLALLDAKGADIAMFKTPQSELSGDSWKAAQKEIRRRDLTAKIDSLESASEDNGVAYFVAHTDRGRREFVVTNISTNVIWFGEARLLLVDAEGNRFEVEDINGLDVKSRGMIDGIL